MKTFETMAAQGDVLLWRIGDEDAPLPADATGPLAPTDGLHVVGHSETGHHHVVPVGQHPGVVELFGSSDPFKAYLRVKGAPTVMKHSRPWDTHETFQVPPGLIEIRRQRERAPEGWVRVAD